MAFKALAGTLTEEQLNKDYESAVKIGPLKMGELAVYQNQLVRVNYIPYTDVQWAFQRIEGCLTKMCCGTQGIDIYHVLVIAGNQQCLDVRIEDKKISQRLQEAFESHCPGADIGFSEELKEKYKEYLKEV